MSCRLQEFLIGIGRPYGSVKDLATTLARDLRWKSIKTEQSLQTQWHDIFAFRKPLPLDLARKVDEHCRSTALSTISKEDYDEWNKSYMRLVHKHRSEHYSRCGIVPSEISEAEWERRHAYVIVPKCDIPKGLFGQFPRVYQIRGPMVVRKPSDPYDYLDRLILYDITYLVEDSIDAEELVLQTILKGLSIHEKGSLLCPIKWENWPTVALPSRTCIATLNDELARFDVYAARELHKIVVVGPTIQIPLFELHTALGIQHFVLGEKKNDIFQIPERYSAALNSLKTLSSSGSQVEWQSLRLRMLPRAWFAATGIPRSQQERRDVAEKILASNNGIDRGSIEVELSKFLKKLDAPSSKKSTTIFSAFDPRVVETLWRNM